MYDSQVLFNFLRNHRGGPIRSMVVFNFVLEAAIMGSLLILLVLVVRALLRKRIGSRAICLAWLLVSVRLLLPVALPNPLMNDLRPTYSNDVDARPIADQIRVRYTDALQNASRAASYQNGRYQETSLSQFLSDMGGYSYNGWTGHWYLYGYLLGAAGVMAYMICQNILFFRKLRKKRGTALSGEAHRSYLALCEEMKIKPLPVYRTECETTSGYLVGVFRPYIVLSASLGSGDTLLTLRRQLIHYKRKTILRALIRNLCCAFHWFHPLVWIAAYLERRDCEFACDEQMLQGRGASDALALSNLLARAPSTQEAPRLSSLSTLSSQSEKQLKQRINAALGQIEPPKWVRPLFACIALLLTAFAFGTAETHLPEHLAVRINKPADAISLASDHMREFLAFSDADMRNGAFTAENHDGAWRVVFTLQRATAGESTLPYLDRWFPNQDSGSLFWVFHNDRTFITSGRIAAYPPDASLLPTDGSELTHGQAFAIAKAAVISHYALDDRTAKALEEYYSNLYTQHVYASLNDAPYPFWEVAFTALTEENSGFECVVHLDAHTGNAFLFLDTPPGNG